MPYIAGNYCDEDTYADARREAAEDAFRDSLPRCGGEPGEPDEVEVPCSGRHAWGCGGPDCDGGYMECPGCGDCEPGG